MHNKNQIKMELLVTSANRFHRGLFINCSQRAFTGTPFKRDSFTASKIQAGQVLLVLPYDDNSQSTAH